MDNTNPRSQARIAALTYFASKPQGFIFTLRDLYDFCECDNDAIKENGARWGVLHGRHKGLIEHTATRAEYIIL